MSWSHPLRRGINARIRGSRNHSRPHAVNPRMRLTIISGVSVLATRRWLVIAPPRNPVRMIAPSTLPEDTGGRDGVEYEADERQRADQPHLVERVAGLERRRTRGVHEEQRVRTIL